MVCQWDLVAETPPKKTQILTKGGSEGHYVEGGQKRETKVSLALKCSQTQEISIMKAAKSSLLYTMELLLSCQLYNL